MRGEKLNISKKAGIALAYRAINDRNDVGLVIFTSRIEKSIPPTRDFVMLLDELAKIRAGQETDLGITIDHAVSMFERGSTTKHLIIISDALPTRGEDPVRIALEAVAASPSGRRMDLSAIADVMLVARKPRTAGEFYVTRVWLE